MSHATAPQGPAGPATPGYETRTGPIFGHGEGMRLRALKDRLQYHDPDGEAERAGIPPAAWPLFGMLWPSGEALAGVMGRFDFLGKRILEVGCGLALASMVAHRRGADVTASDAHPLAGPFLVENLLLNSLPAMKYQPGNWSGANPALGLFDVIIGSDVLYDRGQPAVLSAFIERHSEPAVEVMIMDPERGNQPAFSRHMVALGFDHSIRKMIALPDGTAYRGRLHTYTRGA